jgi:uncharacterized protein YjiS (DUF1127 family)
MRADHSPRRGFFDWIALARGATGQNTRERRLTAFGQIPDHLLDDLGIAPVEFDHAAQLYRRK